MINFALINKITEKTLGRDHTFFANPNRHRPWAQQRLNVDPTKITDLSLECVGYGQFHVTSIVQRFSTYLKNCTAEMPNLRNLRLKINGFDLKDCPDLITNVCHVIQKLPKSSLKLLQIQTTRLLNCDITRDFGQLFKACINLGIKQRHGLLKAQNSFETLTLQFADWQFMYKGRKMQPNPQSLKNQLGLIQDQAFNTDGYCFKRFRLQMSTWYYTQKQADIFFHQYSVDQFHVAMDSFVKSCYNNMPDLEYFQLDIRNWFGNFQLQKLREALMMVPKQGAQNMSINSKNISKMRRKKQDPKMSVFLPGQEQEDVILFERHIMV